MTYDILGGHVVLRWLGVVKCIGSCYGVWSHVHGNEPGSGPQLCLPLTLPLQIIDQPLLLLQLLESITNFQKSLLMIPLDTADPIVLLPWRRQVVTAASDCRCVCRTAAMEPYSSEIILWNLWRRGRAISEICIFPSCDAKVCPVSKQATNQCKAKTAYGNAIQSNMDNDIQSNLDESWPRSRSKV